jgi:hypothetical protein
MAIFLNPTLTRVPAILHVNMPTGKQRRAAVSLLEVPKRWFTPGAESTQAQTGSPHCREIGIAMTSDATQQPTARGTAVHSSAALYGPGLR